MPENEFEKQVQQKMNELKFVPSDAAWEKVQKQIADKKKRRRALLWLPLLLLLLGGTAGYYYMHQKPGAGKDDLAVKPVPANAEKHPVAENNKAGNKTNNIDALVSVPDSAHRNQQTNSTKNSFLAPQEKYNATRIADRQTIGNKNNLHIIAKKIAPPLKGREAAAEATSRLGRIAGVENEPVHKMNIAQKDKGRENENIDPKGNSIVEKIRSNSSSTTSIDREEKDMTGKQAPDTLTGARFPISKDSAGIARNSGTDNGKNIQNDSVHHVTAKQVSHNNSRKIEWGLNFMAGSSGISAGFPGLFEKSLNNAAAYSSPPANGGSSGNVNNNNISYTSPSAVKSHFAWSAGIVVRKPIGKSWRLNAGLNYSMLATGIALGAKTADSAGLGRTVYRNGRSATYTNRFHFIELPLIIEKQLGHRSRFSINGGFAFSLLAGSNQLRFDQQANLYYADNSLINKTQWSLLAGLNYRILQKKIQLETGPLLNYHLGNTFSKDIYGNGHWFFAGVRATVFFDKRKK